MDKIKEDSEMIYKQYTRPAGNKILKLAKESGLNVNQKDIAAFLNSKQSYQQLKETIHVKSQDGHIIAYSPFSLLQLDLYVMLKYEKQNK